MKVVVEDANVLLDLVNGEVLGLWLSLDYEHVTTHLVWGEVTDERQRAKIRPLIDAGKLALREIPDSDWSEVAAFSHTHGVSIADASVWLVARMEGAILLSGDSKLRRSSKLTQIEVRGVLWVLDELVDSGRIDPSAGCEALNRMIASGAFLPPDACDERRKKWSE